MQFPVALAEVNWEPAEQCNVLGLITSALLGAVPVTITEKVPVAQGSV